MSRKGLKVERTGRRRPSGLNANEQRFAFIKMPDGRAARVPAAKDAATYICLANADGDWTENAIGMFAYDVTWLVEGETLQLEEMRPGYGMGSLITVRVVDSLNRMQRHEGNYLQMQRFILCEEVESVADRMALSADELLDGDL